jgi:hypothetical protein
LINTRQKLEKPLPVICGKIHANGNMAEINILLDSWDSQSIVSNEIDKNFKLNNVDSTWTTLVAETFSTSKQTTIVFSLPKLHEKRTIETFLHVFPNLKSYDMILGRDIIQELGIILNFQDATIQ